MRKSMLPIAVTIVLSLSLLLAGCEASSNAGLDVDSDSSEKELPEELKQSNSEDNGKSFFSDEEVYQMDELLITDENGDEFLSDPDSKKAEAGSAASQPGIITVQSKQQTSVPSVPRHNVGGTWYDLQFSGEASPVGSSGIQHNVQVSTEE